MVGVMLLQMQVETCQEFPHHHLGQGELRIQVETCQEVPTANYTKIKLPFPLAYRLTQIQFFCFLKESPSPSAIEGSPFNIK